MMTFSGFEIWLLCSITAIAGIAVGTIIGSWSTRPKIYKVDGRFSTQEKYEKTVAGNKAYDKAQRETRNLR